MSARQIDPDFGPAASLATLRARAELLNKTRRFFHSRGYWEVETPLLSQDFCVDAHIDPLTTVIGLNPARRFFLQSSPEFGMKRLLVAGAGSIFQITRAFRDGEAGALHNPEFTMIEWYRVGATYQELMTEVSDWLTELLGTPAAERMTYHQAFERFAKLRPEAPLTELQSLAIQNGWASTEQDDRDTLLNFLFGVVVQPQLGRPAPEFVFDFPATQSALAKVRPGEPPVAERFELFVNGLELCNGYQELTDAAELLDRNKRQNKIRRKNGKRAVPIDSRLLSAMRAGLPECAGVAVGFDRVALLAIGGHSLDQVLAFPVDRC